VYIISERNISFKTERSDLSPHLERVARPGFLPGFPLNLRFCKDSASHSPAIADRSVWGSSLSPGSDFLACTPARGRKNNFILSYRRYREEVRRILLGIFIKVFLRESDGISR